MIYNVLMAKSVEVSDEVLVVQVIEGDADAYATLMTRYESRLLRYVIYLIHDQAAAEDAVQEAFIKAYQNLRSYKPSYKFSSWIYRIAHNEAMNIVKKNKHICDEDIQALPDQSYESRLDDLVEAGILKERVHECLEEIEPKYREVIQLIYFEGMKYDDVSDVLHIPRSTVGVWLSRAKIKLRTLCKQKGVTL